MSPPPTSTSIGQCAAAWAGHEWWLRADRTLFWPTHATLLLADPHFGKDATFRAAGIPVPVACTDATLARLDAALQATAARRLLVLGDFWHARTGVSAATLARLHDWRGRHAALEITLIRGNHDHSAGDPPAALHIRCVPTLDEAGLRFLHDPAAAEAAPGGAALCGHLHPAARVTSRTAATRLPCFWLRPNCAILPAFGEFTGLHVIRPERDDRVFVVTDNEVLELPPAAARRRRRMC